MIKDGGDLPETCLLWLFNCMLASHFPERLSVGLITAVYKSGDKSDMSNYRGFTVGSVITLAFAMILDQRIASWAETHAESHGVKAKGQAGFRKDFRTTDNIFVLRSLIDKQKQSRQKGRSGKLYCCFVDFKKAFDTVPRDLLWQVLEGLGIHGRILDIIKSLYAHDSAAVRSSQGLSAIFRCLMGVKQGCPLSPTLFGLFVDGLEKRLLNTPGIDAPELIDTLIPLLLYADDLILMSTTEAGVQRQLDALSSFCAERQLTVNLSKTKIVVFETRRSDCTDFIFNAKPVEQVDSYNYLGFTFHAIKSLTYGAGQLVSAARKAVHAMRRRCAQLHITDPALLCKLFNSLVLPILSYACEVWAVDQKASLAAEKLHGQFLKQLLHVRKSTASEIVLAEFGRYPLQIHFWQQVLRYHNRVLKLDNSRLVKIAFSEGAVFVDGRVLELRAQGWRPNFTALLNTQPGDSSVFRSLDVTAIIERQKEAYLSAFLSNETLSTLVLYRSLQPEYGHAHYLSAVQCFPNRRLMSRFRCGCQGLHIDTGRFVNTPRDDRVCEVCKSECVENEHHFLFDCPAYAHIRYNHAKLFHGIQTVSAVVNNDNPCLLGRYLRQCFEHRQSVLG